MSGSSLEGACLAALHRLHQYRYAHAHSAQSWGIVPGGFVSDCCGKNVRRPSARPPAHRPRLHFLPPIGKVEISAPSSSSPFPFTLSFPRELLNGRP